MSENKERRRADLKRLDADKDFKYTTGHPIVQLSIQVYASTSNRSAKWHTQALFIPPER